MRFEPGKVYHQQFDNGDREYFQAVAIQANGRWRGFHTTGRRQPKQCSCDESLPAWRETPAAEIPAKFKA